MDLELTDRLVVVTGASRGIGRAIAETFAREGCRLHLVARQAPQLAEAVDDIRRVYGITVAHQVVDMGTQGAAATVCEACPNADILINNAGGIVRGDLLAISEPKWRAAWEPKVFGYINLTREYFSRMRERRRGVIINVVGLGAEKVDYEYVAGSAGNAAIAAFTRTLGSASLDEGVRVLGVNPGWVETDRTMRLLRELALRQYSDAEHWRCVLASWQVDELIKPADVADIVVFLASDRARALCGVMINVDRGFGARSYPRTHGE
jgi:3-oxoacyl-[acyl-carrier protein] reductase